MAQPSSTRDIESPDLFFDLSSFSERALFDLGAPLWGIAQAIPLYLKGLTLGKIQGEVSPKAYLINPEQISIGEGSVVEPGAYIVGPCLIGKGCTIRHGAYIRGNLITGDRCVIGHATEIKQSLLLNDVHAAHFNYIGNSLLGNRVNLGAGAILANLRLDKREVRIKYKEHQINTGQVKWGAILGDDCQIGCNCVIQPGTLLEKKSLLRPSISCR